MVNNLLGAVAMAAFAEGAALVRRSAFRARRSSIRSWADRWSRRSSPGKRAKIERETYEPDFSLRWMQKDLHLAAISGYEAGVALPVVNVTKEIYRMAMREVTPIWTTGRSTRSSLAQRHHAFMTRIHHEQLIARTTSDSPMATGLLSGAGRPVRVVPASRAGEAIRGQANGERLKSPPPPGFIGTSPSWYWLASSCAIVS